MSKNILYHLPDGTPRYSSGYKVNRQKLAATSRSKPKYANAQLPKRVDLRPFMPEVEAQGELNSCVANAAAGAYEYLILRHKEIRYDVSRLFIYYNARYLETEDEIEDEGTFIESAINGLKEYGACAENTYPYDEDYVNEEPPQEAYDEAADFLVEHTELVDLDLTAWKSALAQGYPIIFGLALFDSFDNQRKKGLIPTPTAREVSRESHSGHAMLCVGYSDTDRVFIVRNSWGDEWGDDGYCYIPYDYMMSEDYNDGDCWIIKQLDYFPEDEQNYWSEDDNSILPDLDSEIGSMSDNDYQNLLAACGQYPLQLRLAMLMVFAAKADGELSAEEEEQLLLYLQNVLDILGIDNVSTQQLARRAQNTLREKSTTENVLRETAFLMKKYFSNAALAKIVIEISNVVSADGLSPKEEEELNGYIRFWQVENQIEQATYESEEYSEEESEEYSEEESEEYSEEESEEYSEEESGEYSEEESEEYSEEESEAYSEEEGEEYSEEEGEEYSEEESEEYSEEESGDGDYSDEESGDEDYSDEEE